MLRRVVECTVCLSLLSYAVACRRVTIVARSSSAPSVRYGPLMVEVGRRFEAAGRAIGPGHDPQWEFARYQIEELTETFDDDLPRASPPRDVDGNALRAAAHAFATMALPALRDAVNARDLERSRAAFGTTARRSNDCHESHGHGFIEIPVRAGEPVPRVGRPAEP